MSGGNSVRVLILGASYGLLPGVRLALAGHAVTLIGRATELAAMAEAPLRLNITRGAAVVTLRWKSRLAEMQRYARQTKPGPKPPIS